MEFGQLTALSSLLKECESASCPQEVLPTSSLQSTRVVLPSSQVEPAVEVSQRVQNEKAIWDDAEVPTEDALVDPQDARPLAKFELTYKHDNVSTGDTFLGLTGRSAASSECTHLVVKIYFPRSRMEDIDLDCTKHRVKASSPHHRMFTYLPVSVDHLKGSAKFDTKTSILTVTLPIIEEDLA